MNKNMKYNNETQIRIKTLIETSLPIVVTELRAKTSDGAHRHADKFEKLCGMIDLGNESDQYWSRFEKIPPAMPSVNGGPVDHKGALVMLTECVKHIAVETAISHNDSAEIIAARNL
jgi:hypothetical protein